MTAMKLALVLALALSIPVPALAQVTVTQKADQITVDIDGKPFTVFHTGGKDLNRPYLHPLRTAAGTIVNRSFPAGQLPGETIDHPHHAGVFYGHGDVNGYNYWAIQNAPYKKIDPKMGRIVVKQVTAVKSGRPGSIEAVLTWLKPDGAPLLTERRRMAFHAREDLRIIDFDIDLEALEKVVFNDTKEGTFAMRMATALEERAKSNPGKLLNAQGAEREPDVWGKRSEWVDYSGEIDGKPVGVVMMDHPGNPRHPTYWHSRGYGLHSINPFGVRDFLNDKTQDGSLTLPPGERVRFRYRVIVHQGASPKQIADLYNQYVKSRS